MRRGELGDSALQMFRWFLTGAAGWFVGVLNQTEFPPPGETGWLIIFLGLLFLADLTVEVLIDRIVEIRKRVGMLN